VVGDFNNMEEIINKWPVIAQVLFYVATFNVLLSALHKSLEAIKNTTETSLDNKAADILVKVIGWVSKILDMIGYNPKHSDKK